MIRLIAIAAATLAFSAGAAMAESDCRIYRDPLPRWMPATNFAGWSGTSTRHELPMRAIVTVIMYNPAAIA
jgi:uncharacterized membrane protein